MDYYVARHRFSIHDELGIPSGFEAFLKPTEMGAGPQYCPFCNMIAADEWHVTPPPIYHHEQRKKTLFSFRFTETDTDCVFSASEEEEGQFPSLQLRMKPKNGDQSLFLNYRYGTSTATILPNERDEDLHFALWYAFALMAAPTGSTLIHSAAIVHNERVVLFLGESGAGKSTHARLWTEHVPGVWLLNDDSPILSLSSEDPLVFGSPWSGKSPCYHNIGYPLKSIVRLQQSPSNAIHRLSPLEAMAAILPSLPPAFAYEEHLKENMLVIAERAIESVPIFHLDCLPNKEAALLCCETIESGRENRHS
ncbi:MAG: hypothetical protein SPJ13_06645 [Bacteroidales bacterium]|nr:hypothetical protein [Bacteroidales bacterium]